MFIAVGTPPDEDGSADLSHVLAVARTIGEHMTEYRVDRQQVDRAGRHRRQGARRIAADAGQRAASTSSSTSSRTPNS